MSGFYVSRTFALIVLTGLILLFLGIAAIGGTLIYLILIWLGLFQTKAVIVSSILGTFLFLWEIKLAFKEE